MWINSIMICAAEDFYRLRLALNALLVRQNCQKSVIRYQAAAREWLISREQQDKPDAKVTSSLMSRGG